MSFCFSGTLEQGTRRDAAKLVRAEGGKVVDSVTKKLSFLVLGGTRRKTSAAEKKAIRLNRTKGAAIRVLSEREFRKLFMPTREQAIAMFRAGPKGVAHWQKLASAGWAETDRVDLSGVELRGARLKGADLQGVAFDDADLRKADLGGAKLAKLVRVRLDGARLRDAEIEGALHSSFTSADLTGATLNEIKHSSFDRARMRDGWGLDFTDSSFVGADLGELDHSFGTLVRCNLSQAKLTGKQSFDYLKAAGTVFRGWSLKGANLYHAELQNADLREADLTSAVLQGADLRRAKLNGARLEGAVLSWVKLGKADLRDADLSGANFAFARLEGAVLDRANLTGANLVGVKLSPEQARKVKGFDPQATASRSKSQVHLKQLERMRKKTKKLELSAVVDHPFGEIQLKVDQFERDRLYCTARSGSLSAHANMKSLAEALVQFGDEWGNGTLRLESIASTTGRKSIPKLPPSALNALVIAAWCEAFGLPIPSSDAIATDQQSRPARLLADLRGGKPGLLRWRNRSSIERRQIETMLPLDLSKRQLQEVHLEELRLRGSNFDGADLSHASLYKADFSQASFRGAKLDHAHSCEARFTGANLERASLRQADFSSALFTGANLRGANLRRAELDYSDLCGADLTDANLSKATLEGASYDEHTRFPKGFVPDKEMNWMGKQPRTQKAPSRARAPLDFDAFMKALGKHSDKARMSKAMSMLKADRFQLFAEVADDSLAGVVKSQTDTSLVYACRLNASGGFTCCTQNLNVCGGLRGALCKHLLVLIVGLTRSQQLDPTLVDGWIRTSLSQKPVLDRDGMGEIFLRYKGAEAGEIDWRPTETIPEDYYAF